MVTRKIQISLMVLVTLLTLGLTIYVSYLMMA
ncbi:hypothetical protein SAMN05421640_1715 [Ekhidna lutea]|uniref:Uncharacterized protein n=1 Tax=Ekhidna lutea TaxID=447679 RepID=A0A239IPB6_EKHLU|nr:hypothetical protein SAMN05421640_1715 [Ekhidna lutea]